MFSQTVVIFLFGFIVGEKNPRVLSYGLFGFSGEHSQKGFDMSNSHIIPENGDVFDKKSPYNPYFTEEEQQIFYKEEKTQAIQDSLKRMREILFAGEKPKRSNKELALLLAKKGYFVFPAIPSPSTSGEYAPFISNWKTKATTHAYQIERWWTNCPEASVGISAQNLLILEVEDWHDPDIPHFFDFYREQLELVSNAKGRLENKHGAPYVYFFYRDFPLKSAKNAIDEGVHIIADDGYFIFGEKTLIEQAWSFPYHKYSNPYETPTLRNLPSSILQLIIKEVLQPYCCRCHALEGFQNFQNRRRGV